MDREQYLILLLDQLRPGGGNVPGSGRFCKNYEWVQGEGLPGLRHQRHAGGQEQPDHPGPDPRAHRAKGSDHQQLGAALYQLQGHRLQGGGVQQDHSERHGHRGRGLWQRPDFPVRQGRPGDDPEPVPGFPAHSGAAGQNPGQRQGPQGTDRGVGGQRAVHLPEDVLKGPGDHQPDRNRGKYSLYDAPDAVQARGG